MNFKKALNNSGNFKMKTFLEMATRAYNIQDIVLDKCILDKFVEGTINYYKKSKLK